MKDLNYEIELNKVIGEMAGTLKGIKILYKDVISANTNDQIDKVLKSYDLFFDVKDKN